MGARMREDVELGGAVTRVRIRRPTRSRCSTEPCARRCRPRARDGGLRATAIRHRIQATSAPPPSPPIWLDAERAGRIAPDAIAPIFRRQGGDGERAVCPRAASATNAVRRTCSLPSLAGSEQRGAHRAVRAHGTARRRCQKGRPLGRAVVRIVCLILLTFVLLRADIVPYQPLQPQRADPQRHARRSEDCVVAVA